MASVSTEITARAKEKRGKDNSVTATQRKSKAGVLSHFCHAVLS